MYLFNWLALNYFLDVSCRFTDIYWNNFRLWRQLITCFHLTSPQCFQVKSGGVNQNDTVQGQLMKKENFVVSPFFAGCREQNVSNFDLLQGETSKDLSFQYESIFLIFA